MIIISLTIDHNYVQLTIVVFGFLLCNQHID
jgi:hypothetical protein